MRHLFTSKCGGGTIFLITAIASLAFASSAVAAPPAPPFKQCPPVGLDTSCGTLIVVNSSGGLEAFNDPSQGPFDGVEDTLIGVQNNSSSSVSSIELSGEFIFGLDGDGICSGAYVPGPPCTWSHPTGYEGPETSFTITNENEGTVNFTGGLAAGSSTYFSLEGPVTCQSVGGKLKCSTKHAEPTETSTSLTGGGKSGEKITVKAGTGVTDEATLSGTNTSTATGTVEYKVYSDSECTKLVTSAGSMSVSGGKAPASESETFYVPGEYYWQASYSGDEGNEGSKSVCGAEVQTVTGFGGNFVIGDENAATGSSVNFWGPHWWKLNSLSGGSGPAAFKGFEDDPALAVCGKSWTTDPGNSTPPPEGPLPAFIPIIVSSNVSKSGSSISGNTVHVVLVKVNPGYAAAVGHAGTGTVVSQIC